ncbi:hypothetical protein BDN72DRAFT_146978 [Pluteus cervinus]|uniref:Uncharacterized protein n=1 Tax=Pluteus cervinus TaxID=181527 RepID=A0ACD3ALC1_9AGAR|nr:hypothetical protein BDN72DRAFT_146978 [Pluteus cervinus]
MASRFTDIPNEVVDQLLANLGFNDVISFAQTCHRYCALAIPRHSEYRVVLFETGLDPTWTHLAQRLDLAHNVRAIHIGNLRAPDPYAYLGPVFHTPETLMDFDHDLSLSICERRRDMLRAIETMTKLETLRWDWISGDMMPILPELLLALSKVDTLRRFVFNLTPNSPAPDLHKNMDHSLLSISNLTSLHFDVNTRRVFPASPNLLRRWLLNLSSLRFLGVQAGGLAADCDNLLFPHLRCLILLPENNAEDTLPLLKFLEKHPGIAELRWFLREGLEPVRLSESFLPNLKRLSASSSLFYALEQAHNEPKVFLGLPSARPTA